MVAKNARRQLRTTLKTWGVLLFSWTDFLSKQMEVSFNKKMMWKHLINKTGGCYSSGQMCSGRWSTVDFIKITQAGLKVGPKQDPISSTVCCQFFGVATCVDRCRFATGCCETHCHGCMNVAWAMFWGGSRSTKPCVFPCKVAATGDERYLVCAAVAAGVVSVANCSSYFATSGCSCVRSSMRFLKL